MRQAIIVITILIITITFAVQDNNTVKVMNPQLSENNFSIPKSINFQGYLYRDGNPMDTIMDMWFGIYDSPGGGNLLYQQTKPNVEVINGWFTVNLANIPDSVFNFEGPVQYLEIKAPATLPPLEPRISLMSVGYSYHSNTADSAAYARSAQISRPIMPPIEEFEIGDYMVTNGKLGSNSVTTEKIQNGTIRGIDIAKPCTLQASVSYPGAVYHVTNTGAGDGVEIGSVGNDGFRVMRAGDDGFQVDSAEYGFVLYRASDDGLWMARAGNNGIYIDSAGSNGVNVFKSGVYGVKVNKAGLRGIQIDTAVSVGVNVDFAGHHGVHVDSCGWSGVAIERPAYHGVHIVDPKRNGVYVDRAGWNGVNVHAGFDGIHVDSAQDDGIEVTKANYGLYVPNATYRGVFISNAGEYGVFANCENERGGYFRNSNNNYYALTAYNATGTGGTVRGFYVQGHGYATGGWQTFLADGKVGFSLTSSDMDMVTRGSASLSDGQAQINFEKIIQEAFSNDAPMNVIITPTAECNGIFVVDKSSSGFEVKELLNGKSNATFDWIAIGRIKGYEQRPDLRPITAEQMRLEEEKNLKIEMKKREDERQMMIEIEESSEYQLPKMTEINDRRSK